MNKRVLFVDDEPNVLSAIRRALRGRVEIETSEDPRKALSILQDSGPFAVVVSDMRMPGMDGAEFLAAARKSAPDTVRIMLTGNADQKTAVDAVNKGEVFKFLTKPTDSEELLRVLSLGLRQYQLIAAEKELLEQTLNGSIKVLSEVLSIAKPEAFGRTDRLRAKAKQIAMLLEDVSEWELDTAASLSLLGCVGLSAELLEKTLGGVSLTRAEQQEYHAHPLLGADLISSIPRMQGVAEIILYQHQRFDGSGFPSDGRRGKDLPLGARVLHLVLAYDDLKAQGWSDAAIYENLRRERNRFDPAVLEALGKCLEDAAGTVVRLPAKELKDGMIIQEDVKSTSGVLLICQGQQVTAAVRRHLANFLDAGMLAQNVLVSAPARDGQAAA